MHLTKEEERVYDGEAGWANQVCMKILVRLGELFGATKLIPISSAHVSGVSYKTLGDAPIEFLKALADTGARTQVEATLNPQSFDPEYLSQRLPQRIREPQMSILRQFDRIGFAPSLTCTPYYLTKPPRGAHLAWAESSAVVYANSVLGAHTNREGGPSALAAAAIGKTADYGIHKKENRQPNISIDVEKPPRNEMEFGALGIHLGRILGNRIPLIRGVGNPPEDCLKQLGAAMAATGMTNMFQITHNANTKKMIDDRITVEIKDMKKETENLSTVTTQKPDLIFLGCPHCSLNEIKRISRIVEGRKIKTGTECWICTSRFIKEKGEEYVKKIEKTGAHVLSDMCTIVSWTETLGIETIMTNSAKTAHYAPTLNKANARLAPLEECLKTAFKG